MTSRSIIGAVTALLAVTAASLAQRADVFVPTEIGARFSNIEIAQAFAKADVQKARSLRVFMVPDPQGSTAEADCVRQELESVLLDWTRESETRMAFVPRMRDANLVINFNREDTSFEDVIAARVKGLSLSSFLSTEGALPLLGERIRQAPPPSGPLQLTLAFDLRRFHSAFFTAANGWIDFSYVWYRAASITGDFRRGDWPEGPYGFPSAGAGGCHSAYDRVSLMQWMLAHAVGAAVHARTESLKAADSLNAGTFDGRNALLARILLHRRLRSGDRGEELQRTVNDLLDRVRPEAAKPK